MSRRFHGRGGTLRGAGARTAQAQQFEMFDDPDDGCEPAEVDAELARHVHRMTLETSSNVYAQRRSRW